MLPTARNQRTPVPHGAQAPVEGLKELGTGQSRDSHAVMLRDKAGVHPGELLNFYNFILVVTML